LGHRRGNNFSAGGAKIGEKQSRQSNSKYNFMQYVFFEKGKRSVQWGLGLSPEAGEFSRIFVLKVTLQSSFGVRLKDKEMINYTKTETCKPYSRAL